MKNHLLNTPIHKIKQYNYTMANLVQIHKNRENMSYLCKFINDNNNCSKWSYESKECTLAKNYLSCIITKKCIKINNFGLPRELWDIICTLLMKFIFT